MAAQSSDEFDVLTFFIYVMALLTAIVGVFALWNRSKVSKAHKELTREISRLEDMDEIALDENFREWLAKDREASKSRGGRTGNDFLALIDNTVSKFGWSNGKLQGRTPSEQNDELLVKLTVKDIRIEDLVRFCIEVEKAWPGARVSEIPSLKFNEKEETWDTTFAFTIFRPDKESS
ncbi:MAG: hypothetical protein R3F62_10015 [Planctomycetota bacterium]